MSFSSYLYKKYINKIFIEAGTKDGICSVNAIKNGFKEVYTIELDNESYNKSVRRCRNNPNIHLYHGDSVVWLPKILKIVNQPYTAWLDAHPMIENLTVQNCPIIQELEIFKNIIKPTGFKILIDDLRLFSKSDYDMIIELSKTIGNISYENNAGNIINDILVIQ